MFQRASCAAVTFSVSTIFFYYPNAAPAELTLEIVSKELKVSKLDLNLS